MTWLVLGLLLWVGAHLFKRLFPKTRETLGNRGRGLAAVAIATGVVLMIVGYRQADVEPLYDLAIWAWYLNNLMMIVALFLIDAGRVNGVVRTKIRHPMLTGVVVWAVAHLLVNGDVSSLVLFGGLGVWALVEMIVISRAEGPWQVPEKGSLKSDGKVAAIAVVLYAVIVGIHDWLDHPPLAFL